jgi:hypothetical protein
VLVKHKDFPLVLEIGDEDLHHRLLTCVRRYQTDWSSSSRAITACETVSPVECIGQLEKQLLLKALHARFKPEALSFCQSQSNLLAMQQELAHGPIGTVGKMYVLHFLTYVVPMGKKWVVLLENQHNQVIDSRTDTAVHLGWFALRALFQHDRISVLRLFGLDPDGLEQELMLPDAFFSENLSDEGFARALEHSVLGHDFKLGDSGRRELEREYARLERISSSKILALVALFNLRRELMLDAYLRAWSTNGDATFIRDRIHKKMLTAVGSFPDLVALLVELVIEVSFHLSQVTREGWQLEAPEGPLMRRSGMNSSLTLSTLLTSVNAFAACFEHVKVARDILPFLEDLTSMQIRNPDTEVVENAWKAAWTGLSKYPRKDDKSGDDMHDILFGDRSDKQLNKRIKIKNLLT